jgi:hypothetical protein
MTHSMKRFQMLNITYMFATFTHEKTISRKMLVYKMYKMQLLDGHVKTNSRIIIPHTTVKLFTIN